MESRGRRQQCTEWPQIQIQVFHRQPVLGTQTSHAFVKDHERGTEALLLLFGEVALVDPVERLAFHELTQQFHKRENQPDQVPFRCVRVGADPV